MPWHTPRRRVERLRLLLPGCVRGSRLGSHRRFALQPSYGGITNNDTRTNHTGDSRWPVGKHHHRAAPELKQISHRGNPTVLLFTRFYVCGTAPLTGEIGGKA